MAYGVIGAGSFGTAVANLLAENDDVMVYSRRADTAENVAISRSNAGQPLHVRVSITRDLSEVTERCRLIFPTIPSTEFRQVIRHAAPFLRPDHMLIHTTKGLDLTLPPGVTVESIERISRENIHTMSEVIRQETVVIRVGCMAGPNLAAEIAQGKPAATVIASKFDEVIGEGIRALRSSRFRVYQNHDITGAELSGVLKNTIAIAAGILQGMDLGENARALLVTMGLGDMIRLGRKLGSDLGAFLGLAGIGDLIATTSSRSSRNFTVGFRLTRGETLPQILTSMTEVAEGVNTVRIATALARHYKIRIPVIGMLHRVLFEGLPISEGLKLLMEHPFDVDAEFL
jgi:glycerol-3-phosphate dehydrogenase (NAD(P)+)